MKDYYSILELNQNASREMIERAYRVLVKRYHPDLQGNSIMLEDKIRDINEAYKILSDPFLKQQYDEELLRDKEKNYGPELQEHDYARIYREQEREKYNAEQKEKENKPKTDNGTAMGIVNLIKMMLPRNLNFKNFKLKNLDSKAYLAMGLTIIIVALIGVALYYIPFTHDWMYRNFIDTPIVNLFRK